MRSDVAILVWIMVLHFIADFLLQSREMGKKKSENFEVLFQHISIQFFVMYMGLIFFVWDTSAAFYLAGANMVIHGIIDWNIWKLYKLSAFMRCCKRVSAKKGYWDQPPEEDKDIKQEIANWKYWEDHWFYATIGFDQLLHVSTLILLAKYIL